MSTQDGADNITTANELADVLEEVTTIDFDELSAVGDDTIVGGEGDDLIFGDALFTDLVATEAGLSNDPGAGWECFRSLEAGDAATGSYTFDNGTTVDYANWTRTDTINYILENQAGTGPRVYHHSAIVKR